MVRGRWVRNRAGDYDAGIDCRDVEHKEEQYAREEEGRSEEAGGQEARSEEAGHEGGEEVDPRAPSETDDRSRERSSCICDCA
jgi:hypothetical protein